MDCRTEEITLEANGLAWLLRFFRWPLERRRWRGTRLDLEVMSDYMKRDLGFLDGRASRRDTDG